MAIKLSIKARSITNAKTEMLLNVYEVFNTGLSNTILLFLCKTDTK